jgi:type IV pilus assembly protein PilC
MPTFSYKAKDKAGNTVTGAVEAVDERAAAGTVREMGHLPMEIRQARAPRAGAGSEIPPQHGEAGNAFARYLIYPIWTGVSIKMLALFYRQLATMLAAGLSLSEALRSQENRTRGRLGVIIAEMRANVSNGGRFSDTMSRYPKVFSRLQIALIRAGEGGGLLDSMVDRIASYLEYEMKVRALIAKALVYPIAILILALLAWVCVPSLDKLVNGGFAPFWAEIWPRLRVWVVGAIVLVVALKLIFQFHTPRLIFDAVKVNIPIVGGNAHKIAMSRFSRALAVLYAAGMSLAESVDIAADASGNLFVGRAVKYAVPALQSGQGLTESLTRTRVVSPMVLDMLAVGERSGSTDAVLEKVAEYMDDEIDASIHKLGIALFILMLLIAGGIVGYIVITFWMKLYGGLLGSVGK